MSTDEEDFRLVRLRDDPGETPELSEALAREAELRVAFDESKGLARLQASLAASQHAVRSEPASVRGERSSSTSMVRWIGLAILVGGAALFGVLGSGADRGHDPKVVGSAELRVPSSAEAPETNATNAEAPEQRGTPATLSLPVEVLPAAAPASPPSVARSSSVASAAPAKAKAPSPTSNALEETLHLGELRRIATSEPQRALAMVEQGNRRFVGGSFREEREAIAVGALARLGHETEAKQRGAAFLETYPASPFVSAVRRAAGL